MTPIPEPIVSQVAKHLPKTSTDNSQLRAIDASCIARLIRAAVTSEVSEMLNGHQSAETMLDKVEAHVIVTLMDSPRFR